MTASTTTNNTPAVRRVDPNRPVQSMATLHDLLQSRAGNIAEVLPKHLTPEKLIKLVMVAANRSPKLLQCKGLTILESVMRAAELGLELSGTMGEAYLVPYKDTCQLIPGYRGLAKLARQSGEVRRIEAEVVYTDDHFVYRKGAVFQLEFTPNFTQVHRGDVLGAYALVEFKDGGIQADFMPAHEIERVRQMSQGRNAGPWTDHWDEMAKKTVFRRLAKWLPLSSEKFDAAVSLSDQEIVLPPSHAPAQSKGGAAALNAALEEAADSVADDQPQPDDDTETDPTWTDAVNALIAKSGCDSDTAEQVIGDAIASKFKKDPSELTPKQVRDTIAAVEAGKITAPEPAA